MTRPMSRPTTRTALALAAIALLWSACTRVVELSAFDAGGSEADAAGDASSPDAATVAPDAFPGLDAASSPDAPADLDAAPPPDA